MNSANGKKTFSDEKVLLDTALLPTTDSISCAGRLQSTKPKANSTMSRLWHVSFALTILGLLIFSMVTATSGDGASGSTDDQGFQELLESIEPTALHEILHNHLKEKFKHGVYQEDKTAMEVVHQQNAEVARNLVELAKRQAAPASNGTITTTSSASSSVTTSEESTTSPPSSTSSSSIESPSASSISTPTFTPTLSSNSTSQSSNSGSGNSPSQTTASSTSGTLFGAEAAVSSSHFVYPATIFPFSTMNSTVVPVPNATMNYSSMITHIPGCSRARRPEASHPDVTFLPSSRPPNSSFLGNNPTSVFGSSLTVATNSPYTPFNYSFKTTFSSLFSAPRLSYNYSSLNLLRSSKTTSNSLIAPTPDHSSTLDHGSVTQSIIYSTTLAGGIQSIVTQITIVPADQAASQANGGKATNTNTASASLQTNSANASARSFSLGICIGTLNLLFAWFS